MRRLVLALPLLLIAVFALDSRSATFAASVQYAPGWNLVSGPDGAHLVGASGPLYTLQPGDTSYESLPAGSALKAGWGYWAFFPNGGSLSAGDGTLSYSVTPTPGQWLMVGNPSGSQTLALAGAAIAYTYTPAGGYSPATALPPGQGAFVQAQQQIALGATTAAAPLTAVSTAAPESVSGALTIDGAPAPSGTTITAHSNGGVCGSSTVSVAGRFSLSLAPEGAACAAAGAAIQFGVTPSFGSEILLAATDTFQPGVTTQRDLSLDLRRLTPNPDNVPWSTASWSQTTNLPIAICGPLSNAATAAANTAFSWWQDAARSGGLAITLQTNASVACSDNQPGIVIISGPLQERDAIAATAFEDVNHHGCNLSDPCPALKAVIDVNDAVFNRLDTQGQARALAHEMGHALGLAHAYTCDGGTLMWKDDSCIYPVNHVGVDDIASLNRKVGAPVNAAGTAATVSAEYESGDATLESGPALPGTASLPFLDPLLNP